MLTKEGRVFSQSQNHDRRKVKPRIKREKEEGVRKKAISGAPSRIGTNGKTKKEPNKKYKRPISL